MKKKKLLTGMLATALSVSMICSNANITQAQETNDVIIANDETGIPDTNLYNAILKEADSNGDGKLTVAEAKTVWGLCAENLGIKDLTGIQYCKNIGKGEPGTGGLLLSGNQIKDISALSFLDADVKLTNLDLSNNQLTNVDGLSNLTYVDTMIDLSNNQLTNVDGLSSLTKAYLVYLSNNQISDISGLNQLTGVNAYLDIRLDNNQLTNVDGLSNLKEVWKMDLSNNKLTDISGLSSLETVLDWFNLENNQLTNVNGLSALKEVECNLYLSNNQISDVSGFYKELQIGGLHLANNKIKDVTPLANLKEVWKLDLSNNNIRDISTLDILKENGCEIITDGNPIGEPELPKDIILNDETGIPDGNLYNAILKEADSNGDGKLTVAEANAISSLNAQNAKIKDLTGIEYCKNLYELYLNDNEIRNVDAISNFDFNGIIDLSHNQITDITPLEGKKFDTLDLSYNQINNVVSNLVFSNSSLNLSHNQISDISPLKGDDFVNLDLSYNQIVNINALADISYSTINLSNNQITTIDKLDNAWNVNLSNNQISNIYDIGSVWRIDLSNNQISDISFLNGKIADGGNIYLSNNKIKIVSSIEGNIYRLDLSDNQISDISPLKNAIISELDLSNNQIRDISALDILRENGCEIITDGNPIGEPEEDKPNEDEKPSEPTIPENPNDEQKPSEPTTPDKPNKPIYNSDNFAELLEKQDIVVKPNEYVTITFEKGSKLNDTNGKNEFDFTTTITTDYTNAKLPTFITKNSFITKVSYTYSGVLPSKASIEIFVGKDYVGKEVFYFLLNDDNTFDKNEVQKVKVNENGYIKVTQEHCSDYVVTTENPETLYEATQTPESKPQEPEQPKDETTNNPENNGTTNDNTTNDNNNKEESPKTGTHTSFDVWCIAILSGIMLIVLYKRKQA